MSEMALKLIAQAKEEGWKKLNLANCGIQGSVPEEVGELLQLEELILSESWWDDEVGGRKLSPNVGPKNEIVALTARMPPNLRHLAAENTQVADLSPLKGLVVLQRLRLNGTQVADISPIKGLASLQALWLNSTLVADISPLKELAALQLLILDRTQVADISPIKGLASLQTLYLYGTQVTDISPLTGLESLQTLSLAATQVADISPLKGLASLQGLYLNGTQVTDISTLKGLTSLNTLYLNGTQVGDISPLNVLASLQSLDLRSTQVADLSPLKGLIEKGIEVKLGGFDGSDGIFLKGCPLTNPPVEVVAKGDKAILKYWAEREAQGSSPIYETKLVIVGEGGVGKTTLLRRLFCPDEKMPDGSESTKGIRIHPHTYPIKQEQDMTLNVWDFGGQEIYHATHQFFLTKRSLYVLVDDTRADDAKAEDAKFKYWLEIIELLGGDSPVLIFQNEKSGRRKDLDKLGIRKQFPNVHQEFYAGDLISPQAADKLRLAIERIAQGLPHVGENWPKKWFEIRQALQALSAEKPYISLQEYFTLYKQMYEGDEHGALQLSAWLHDLGVLLHFQDDEILRDITILQNEWGTDAVFKVLDDRKVVESHGRFTAADCNRIWDDPKYKGKQKELRQLMLKFELSYELRDTAPQQWLATQLLPQTPPEHGFGENPGDLVMRYAYEVMPKGLVARLMVRLNRYVANAGLAWRQGVVFEHRDTKALVYIPYSKKEIHLRARGPGQQILMALISEDLEALNGTFEGLKDKVTKLVPCICGACKGATEPHLYDIGKLLLRKKRGKKTIECGNDPFEEVEVQNLLDGIGYHEMAPDAREMRHGNGLQTIRIFLASSAEMEFERKEFEIFINRENKRYINEGIFLHLEVWEDFIDAMSKTRLQDEYNKAVQQCDIFLSMFFTKAGKYTEEEFGVALEAFMKQGKPQVYTYFKDADVRTGSIKEEDLLSMLRFKKRLWELGHYPTSFTSVGDLKHRFSGQLRALLPIQKGQWPKAQNELSEQIKEGFNRIDNKLDQHTSVLVEKIDQIAVFAHLLPRVIEKLNNVQNHQTTIFLDLKQMGARLENKVGQNQAELKEMLDSIEGSLRIALDAMSPAQRAEYESLVPVAMESIGKSIVDHVKLKIPLIPLAVAILTGCQDWEMTALAGAMSRSLELDVPISKLARTWDKLKLWAAN